MYDIDGLRRPGAEPEREARRAVVLGLVVVVVGQRDVEEHEARLADELLDALEAPAVVRELRRELEQGPAVVGEERRDGVEQGGQRLALVADLGRDDEVPLLPPRPRDVVAVAPACLLYTSDAADEGLV